MKIKNLDKATRIFESIKKLDEEIIKIDKYAMLAATGKTNVSINFEIFEDKKEDILDSDGSLRMGSVSHPYLQSLFRSYCEPVIPKKTEGIQQVISDVLTLQILGVILSEKNTERNRLINELQELGFKI